MMQNAASFALMDNKLYTMANKTFLMIYNKWKFK